MRNPFSPPHIDDTLDGHVVGQPNKGAHLGWRLVTCVLYQALLSWFSWGIVAEFTVGSGWYTYPLAEPYFHVAYLVPLGFGLVMLLLLFQTQFGWVLATTVAAAVLVLSIIVTLATIIPGFLPYHTGWVPVITGSTSTVLAGVVFSLLSHSRLRSGFGVPRSWIRRCVTLGGLLGTGVGMYLIWVVQNSCSG